MEISKKTFVLTIVLVAVLSCAFSLSYKEGFLAGHRNPSARVNVYVFKETPEGIDTVVSGNVITDIGELYVRNILGFDNVTTNNATQWISLGNSTIGQTLTKLDTEATTTGFTRAANDTCIAWINSGDYAYNVTKKFTATGNIVINATMLHWSPISNSDNNGFSLASLGGSESFQNNWNCTIIWVITWNAN